MKKTSKKKASSIDDMPPEYRLDYSKAKPNRFAAQLKDTIAVVLDADVAEAFNTSESVNAVLRSIIAAMEPKPLRPRAPKTRTATR